MSPDWSNSEQMEQVFAQLKPLYGSVIDKYWVAYMAGNPRDKAEIIQYLTMLSINVQHKRIGERKLYLEPPKPSVVGGGEYTIGTVSFPGLPPYPFTLYRRELLRHLFLLGPSGTGKTTLLVGLLRQMLKDGTPFWCIDWKRNYRCLTADTYGHRVIVLTIGSDAAPLRLNILQPPNGVSRNEWAESLSDAISAGYLLMQGARNVLKESLLAAMRASGDRATLRDALHHLSIELRSAGRGRRYGWLESSYRSIEELTKGPFGDSLNEAEHPMTINDLLRVPVVFELEGLGQDQKRAFCVYLLQAVLLTRKKQSLPREVLHHALLFDEAHNVFFKERRDEPPSVQSTLAKEVREYGEAIIAATQQTDISDSIIANSGTKLFLRLDFPWDQRFASDLLHIEPRWLSKIPDGHGVARLPARYLQPFLFAFPEQPLKNTPVTDADVAERYAEWRQGTPTSTTTVVPVRPATIGTKELSLLRDIAAFPYSTITQRYERLHWNPKIGNTTKDRILNAQLATIQVIEAGRSRMKLLTLTPQGEHLVTQHGGTITKVGPGGIEHEYWRHTIKTICEAQGYAVTKEHDLGKRHYADLYATRHDRTIIMEVETGTSDVTANTEKREYADLIMFFTNTAAHDKHKTSIPEDIIILTPDTINLLQQHLR